MAAQTNLHASEQPTSALIGYNVRRAGVLDFISNANVVAATGVDDLIDNVEAAFAPAEYDVMKQRVIRALRFGKANGDLSDARVAAATTVEELADLTWAAEDDDNNHLGPGMIG